MEVGGRTKGKFDIMEINLAICSSPFPFRLMYARIHALGVSLANVAEIGGRIEGEKSSQQVKDILIP